MLLLRLRTYLRDSPDLKRTGGPGLQVLLRSGKLEHWTPMQDRTDNPDGLHLNAIARAGESLYLAGEQGHDRPEALAAGGDEVKGDLGEEVLAALEPADQQFLNLVESPSQGGGEVCVTDVHAGHHVVRRRVRGAGRH